MLTLYNPATKAFFNTDGVDGVSPQILLLNILIELRALHGLNLQVSMGAVTETAAQLRLDVVNAANTLNT